MDNTYTGWINHYFLALCDDVALDPTREAFEDIENILVTPEECEAMIFDGTIECCFTPAIYFLAKIKTKNFTDFSS